MGVVLSLLGAVWGSSLGRSALIGGGLFLVGWLKGYSAVDVEGAVRKALVSRDAEWTQKLDEANNEHERDLDAAQAAARAVVDADPGRDALIRLCRDAKAGADCREKGSNRLQGVR